MVYDNGLFLYSHHATDSCSRRLVNAFDAVDIKTLKNRLPPYQAMYELAVSDALVSKQLAKERAESVSGDFGGLVADDREDENFDWTSEPEINNIWLILRNAPNLRGKFALNEFAGRGELLGSLPWTTSVKRRAWSDNDNKGLYCTSRRRTQLPTTARLTLHCPSTANAISSTT